MLIINRHITKSLLDLMGGTIEVITSPGSGTEIVIRLKFQIAEAGDVPESEKFLDGSLPLRETPENEVDFIYLLRKSFTHADFSEGLLRIPYVILPERLHAGRNTGCIRIRKNGGMPLLQQFTVLITDFHCMIFEAVNTVILCADPGNALSFPVMQQCLQILCILDKPFSIHTHHSWFAFSLYSETHTFSSNQGNAMLLPTRQNLERMTLMLYHLHLHPNPFLYDISHQHH